MRSLPWAALLATIPALAQAQFAWMPAPGPGRPVNFVACPAWTGAGTWVATDPESGYTYSLVGAPPPPPNVFVRVTGVVSPQLAPVPGWALAPIKVTVGRQPCLSAGLLPPSRGNIFTVLGAAPPPPPPPVYGPRK